MTSDLTGQNEHNLGKQLCVEAKDVAGMSLDILPLEEGAHVRHGAVLGPEEGAAERR